MQINHHLIASVIEMHQGDLEEMKALKKILETLKHAIFCTSLKCRQVSVIYRLNEAKKKIEQVEAIVDLHREAISRQLQEAAAEDQDTQTYNDYFFKYLKSYN